MIKHILLISLFVYNLQANTKSCQDYWNEFTYNQQILLKDNSDCKVFKTTLIALQNAINQCSKEKTPVASSGHTTENPNENLNYLKNYYKEHCK